MGLLLRLHVVSKSFGGVHALSGVDLEVAPGEVHAIVGENGAGKSTLMKVISGAYLPDQGEIEVRGKRVAFNGPRDSARQGIAIVYQEPTYYPHLSVLENFFSGEELVTRLGRIDWRRMRQEATQAIAEFNFSPQVLDLPMRSLNKGDQQLILIARAVYRKSDLLILDEPTSILSQSETDLLFRTIRRLRDQGKSVLYISHRMNEIFAISDTITVLRDGEVVGHMKTAEAGEDDLVQLMTGRKVERSAYQAHTIQAGEPVLEVSGLTLEPLYRKVSFELRAGEVLAFYGLVGSGRSEVARTIFGDLHSTAGMIRYRGETLNRQEPRKAIAAGIAYVPEDRKVQGIFAIRAISENLVSVIMERLAKAGLVIDRSGERAVAERYVEMLRIKTGGLGLPIMSLSGGNQQKVIIGRWLASEPDLIIMDEPTRGVDVGTKVEIHRLIRDLAAKGKAVLLISSELPEVLALGDRVIVMHEGDQVAELPREQATEENVLRWAIGLTGVSAQ
jgi:ABC-type sugar transport system ATPase subunit